MNYKHCNFFLVLTPEVDCAMVIGLLIVTV